jgi:hypothetical protein
MRTRKNPNYLEFSKAETVVAFARDRGELRTNDFGEFFFRETIDGRFTCASPELERRLVDAGYTAHQRVAITRETHNRAVIWKVRLIDGVRPIDAGRDVDAAAPSVPPAPHAIAPRPAPIPESKYASPPAVRPELEAPAATKPAGRATENRATDSTTAVGVAHVSNILRACLCAAIDAARDAQIYATQNGFPLTFSADQVQDLASTLYIQEAKQANIRLMNRNDDLRRASSSR